MTIEGGNLGRPASSVTVTNNARAERLIRPPNKKEGYMKILIGPLAIIVAILFAIMLLNQPKESLCNITQGVCVCAYGAER